MTFNEIMDYKKTNTTIFDELFRAVKRGNVVPFVGAGLSCPIYPTWSSAVERLSGYVLDDAKRDSIIELIKSGKMEDAADGIECDRGIFNIEKDMLSVFSEEILDHVYTDDLKKMAVYKLPNIFPNAPVITTNFDRVLEHVYSIQGKNFNDKYCPDNVMSIASLQSNLHTLFKIHGDIGKEFTDYSKIIFSKRSYNSVYTDDSRFRKELIAFYQGKILLFLGCSLNQDRTLDLLKEAVEGTGCTHFAIISVDEGEDISNKVRFLGEHHIRAIFYPNGSYECVSLILDELMSRLSREAPYFIESNIRNQSNEIEDKRRNEWVYNVLLLDDDKEQVDMLRDDLQILIDYEKRYAVRVVSTTTSREVIYESKDMDFDVYCLDVCRKANNPWQTDEYDYFGADLYRLLENEKPNADIKSKFFIFSKLSYFNIRREFGEKAPISYFNKQDTGVKKMAIEIKKYLDELYSKENH